MGLEKRSDENDHNLTGQTDLKEDQINIVTAQGCFEEFDY